MIVAISFSNSAFPHKKQSHNTLELFDLMQKHLARLIQEKFMSLAQIHEALTAIKNLWQFHYLLKKQDPAVKNAYQNMLNNIGERLRFILSHVKTDETYKFSVAQQLMQILFLLTLCKITRRKGNHFTVEELTYFLTGLKQFKNKKFDISEMMQNINTDTFRNPAEPTRI